MDAFADIETTELRPETKQRLARMAKSREFKGVFQPGSASWPPLLVGRQRQANRINALLDELLAPPATTRGIHAVSLHGPRGAGKTVLIDMVSRAVKNNAKRLSALRLTGDELRDPAAVVSEIHAFIPAETATTTTKAGSISLLVGRGRVSISKSKPSSATAHGGIAHALRRFHAMHERRPLVVVDEAHAAAPQALGGLLNALQSLNGNGVPCAAILAGTPDLLGILRKAKATWYLDRNPDARLVPVGNITDADCALAISAPLNAMNVQHDGRALLDAACWCSGNPYFTQALGAAALNAAFQGGKRNADFSAGGPVWKGFQPLAVRRYLETWQNLDELGLTGCARQLGALWRSAKAGRAETVYAGQVECAVSSGLRNPPTHKLPAFSEQEVHAHFTHLGLLWSPCALPDGPWELGLPSFFDFVEERYRDPRQRYYHKTLDALIQDQPSFIPEDDPEEALNDSPSP